MKVLWLTPELPYWPRGSGGSTRQFQLIRRLVERGHDVHVVAPVHPSQRDGVASLTATGATLSAALRPDSRLRETARALARRPALAPTAVRLPLNAWQVEVFWTRLRPLALRALGEQRPDVVLVEHDWAARWIRDLPLDGIPTVLGLENLSWVFHAKRAASETGRVGRAIHGLDARRFAAFDRRELARYDLLLTMSELDRERLAAITDRPDVVIPNGVDTTALVPGPPVAAPVALFTGTFAYGPNLEALRWLLADVWPRIRAAVPDAELLVVGRGVPGDVAAAAPPEVTIAGWVAEMQPWFDRARAVLVPVLSGAGTRLKVLDGLASGRPVVSTTMGAEGIALTDGRDALLADGPEAFAGAAARVLEDDALAGATGAAGRELAERRYDWGAIGDRLADALTELAQRGDGGGA
jgi:glycosyltransferase involved in cell wall biosynthesis